MTTAKEAKDIIAKSRQVNVIRSSIPGEPAVAELPEIQCSSTGIKSPEHYRELLEIIQRDHDEQWNRLAAEHTELRKAYLKLTSDHARAITDLDQDRRTIESLNRRLIAATEMKECPPSNQALTVSCPTCGSIVGLACRDEHGNSRGLVNFHDARVKRYEKWLSDGTA